MSFSGEMYDQATKALKDFLKEIHTETLGHVRSFDLLMSTASALAREDAERHGTAPWWHEELEEYLEREREYLQAWQEEQQRKKEELIKRQNAEGSMWILIGGHSFGSGFDNRFFVGGPFKNEVEADEAAPAWADMYNFGSEECEPVKLTKVDDEDYDPAGTAVVFDGDITRPQWMFYGPFRNIEAAQKWCEANDGFAIELKPVLQAVA